MTLVRIQIKQHSSIPLIYKQILFLWEDFIWKFPKDVRQFFLVQINKINIFEWRRKCMDMKERNQSSWKIKTSTKEFIFTYKHSAEILEFSHHLGRFSVKSWIALEWSKLPFLRHYICQHWFHGKSEKQKFRIFHTVPHFFFNCQNSNSLGNRESDALFCLQVKWPFCA